VRHLISICILAFTVTAAMAQAPNVRIPDESAGIDGITQTLITGFDQFDILALGEAHGKQLDSDLQIALVRHPDFVKKVRSIVIEFGSTTEQETLDRYIRGESISTAQLARVWKTTVSPQVWANPIYADFFAAVRDVNAKLPVEARIRVFGGDPGNGSSRDTFAISVLKAQVMEKHGKALVIFGAGHFYRPTGAPGRSIAGDIGIARTLEIEYPGRTLVVIPLGGRVEPPPPGTTLRMFPDYEKVDRALKTKVRPVLVSLRQSPFRDFTAEEFIGHQILNCNGPAGCRSLFQGSSVTLGQIADAGFYVGGGAYP
jgi:hypothetical protein